LGLTVKVDKSNFGNRKYKGRLVEGQWVIGVYKGRLVEGQWVIGGICRETGDIFGSLS